MDKSLRIVYMGTPDFAVEALSKLVEGGYNIVGVITMPDKPVGRHQTELQQSPVKKYALEHGLKVLQPEKLKDEAFLEELRSLLPQYRGAAPINWAIINGDTETGITTFFLDHEIDTGKVIQRVKVPILDTDNAEDIHDKLMHLGASLVVETVDNIINNRVNPIPQSELTTDEPLRPAPKIFKETCNINWNLGVKKVYDFIRGLSPYPAAWTTLVHGGKRQVVKIYASHKEFCEQTVETGKVVSDGKTFFKIALQDGFLHLDTIQLAGKKRMEIVDFLRGFHLSGDERVEA